MRQKVELDLGNEGFVRGLNEAERRSRGFEQQLSSLFRRSPLARAERAFSELATDLSTGNVAQAVGNFATRITGLGLGVGIAVGAAIGIFQRFAATVKESDLAVAALNAQIDKPHDVTSGLGVAGIAAELQKTVQLTDQLIAKSTTFGARLKAAFSQSGIVGGLGAFITGGRLDFGTGDVGAAGSAQLKTRQDLANTESDIADIREKALIGSEKEATVADISEKAAEKKAAVLNETLDLQNAISLKLKEDAENRAFGKAGLSPSEIKRLEDTRAHLGDADAQRLANIDKIAALEKISAANRIDDKQRQLEIERSISAQALLGISDEDQKISRLKQELALLERQLGPARMMSDTLRQQLQFSLAKTKAELDAALKARGPVTRPPIGIAGETPQGIYDPNTGEFRNILRPQEMANLRGGQTAAEAALRGDQSQYESDLREWQSRYADYLRGADYYKPAQLKRPEPPAGYDIDPATGQIRKRAQEGDKTKMTKEEFQSALDAVMGKYWGQ